MSAEFTKLQTNLISQTELTRTFFDKLVSQLQKGMGDMANEFRAGPVTASKASTRGTVMDVTD